MYSELVEATSLFSHSSH